jgi:splicing factor U2AF subunit
VPAAAPAAGAAAAAPPAPPPDTAALLAQLQAQAAAQQQQMLAARMAAQAQALVAAQATAAAQATRKQRELYVGNLTVHVVSAAMLTELFNGALATLLPPGAPPAVANTNMDSAGKFAFVEMRTDELATAALMLDKVELCGRAINVGRPKGYIDPSLRAEMMGAMGGGGMAGLQAAQMAAMAMAARGGAGGAMAPQAALMAQQQALAAMAAAGMTIPMMQPQPPPFPFPGAAALPPAGAPAMDAGAGGAEARCVLLMNLVPAATLADARERSELTADVADECRKCGEVTDAAAPPPPAEAIAAGAPARVYVRFATPAGAAAAAAMMHGRMFDGNRVAAAFVAEEEHEAALGGAWPTRA